MAVDLDKPIKRDHTANVKNHGIRRLAPTSVYFNGIPSTQYHWIELYAAGHLKASIYRATS